MTRRNLVMVGLLLAALASPAGAEPGTAARPRAGAKHSSRTATKPAATKAVPPAAAARTLEDIHIEGEIPVPQVLFITARDQRRFVEFQHRRYLRTSRKVGEDTVLPSRIVVTGARPGPDKENPR